MNNGKICVSVCAETADKFIENIQRAAEFADVVELRFDCLNKEVEPEILWTELKKLRQNFRGHLLATFRPKEQGGKRKLSLNERRNFWHDSHVYEFVDWGDFEFDLHKDDWDSYFKAVFRKIFRSHHDFHRVPPNLSEIYESLCNLTNYINPGKDSDVVKIAVQTDDISDTIAVWKLLQKAKKDGKQIIPIAMGEAGKWTRILGLAHGAVMTYASPGEGKETASGQLTAKELIETYRVKELNENTEIYGIVGNPVSHSVSPAMHNAAFKFHNLNAVFIPFQVKNLGEFIKNFIRPETRKVELNFRGFSVTIPHKQAIIEYLDEMDETAKAIGAVNTVKIENGKLYGYNTDAFGFIEPLKSVYGNLAGAKAAVIGAGGAARAVIYALKKEDAEVTIFARNLEKAKYLVEDFQVELKELSKTKDQRPKTDFSDFDILINATPLGTKGELESETPALADEIKNISLCYDLVYNPTVTRFLREANSANVPTLNGLQMLVAQGAAQFKIWTGKDAPVDEMSASGIRKLQS